MFSLNSVTKISVITPVTVKGLEPAISCGRDQDATTVSARHMWETGSLNWAQFMLQCSIRFPEFTEFSEFLFHLGKTPMWNHTGFRIEFARSLLLLYCCVKRLSHRLSRATKCSCSTSLKRKKFARVRYTMKFVTN